MIKIESGNQTLIKWGIIVPILHTHKMRELEYMKIKATKKIELADGKHEGTIEDIRYRDDPYAYTDVLIKVDDSELKVSYPTNIQPDSVLGELLARFGAKIEVGTEYEIEEFLTKGKEVVFQTIKQKSKKDGKEYTNIIKESLKPKE